MKTRIALFALALALPLAACGDDVDTVETDTTTIETPDVDATMENMENDMDAMGAEMEEGVDAMGAEMEEMGNDIEAGAAEMEEDMDGDNDM